jgi:hypothetical protein
LEDLGIAAEWVSEAEVRLRFPPPPAPPARRGAGLVRSVRDALICGLRASYLVRLLRDDPGTSYAELTALLACIVLGWRRVPTVGEGWTEWRLCPGYLMASSRASQVEVCSFEGLRVRQVRPDRWILEARTFVPMGLAHSPTKDEVQALGQYVAAVTGVRLDDRSGSAVAASMWERR